MTKLDPCPSVARVAGVRVHPCLMNRLGTMSRLGGIALLLTLAACASQAPPPDMFYRIEPAAPATRFAKPPLPGVLEVQRLTAEGVLDERAITFVAKEGGALSHYKYDLWSETPGLMLQDRLSRFLAGAGAADRVLTPEMGVLADWTLRGKLRRLEYIADGSKVAVGMELGVVSAHDGALVLLENYSVLIPSGSGGIEGAVVAMERGVTQIFARFLTDLGQARAGGMSR